MLCIDNTIITTSGIKCIDSLSIDEEVFDDNGNICNIICKKYYKNIEAYKIFFDDNFQLIVSGEQNLFTWTRNARHSYSRAMIPQIHPSNKSIIEISKSIRANKDRHNNHSIKLCDPLQYSNKDLVIDPYVLGCWLGDGSSNNGQITTMDQQILDEINQAGYETFLVESSVRENNKASIYRIGKLIKSIDNSLHVNRSGGELYHQLKKFNLLNNKHIPDVYQYGSYKQRLFLLQGLMDTDGSCDNIGRMEYCTVLPILANAIVFLIRSLGIRASVNINESWLYDQRCQDRYRISFNTSLPVFRLKRKLINIKQNHTTKMNHRMIVAIEKINNSDMVKLSTNSISNNLLISDRLVTVNNYS